MDKLDIISLEIESLYPKLQDLKLRDEIIKEVLREKSEKMNIERFSQDGIVLKFRRHTEWKWKKEFYEKLEDEAKLPLAVNVSKKMEKQFDIEDFRLPVDDYIRIYARNTKVDSEIKEEKRNELRDFFDEMTLEDLILHYKINKIDLTIENDRYKNQTKQLKSAMGRVGCDSYKCSVGTFKIMLKEPDYDIDSMFYAKIKKSISFLYKIENNEAFIHDLHTGNVFSFVDSCSYEEQLLEIKKNILYVEHQPLVPFDGLSRLKKKEKEHFKPFLDDGFNFASTEVEIDGMQFFKHCPISSTKVDELIDQGLMEGNALEKYRFIESENDLSIRFEVIDEDVEAGRKIYFHNRLIRRSEKLRERR